MAKRKKYIMTTDETVKSAILDKLRENGGYCPCAIVKTKETKCVCKNMRDTNICECGLYTGVEGAE